MKMLKRDVKIMMGSSTPYRERHQIPVGLMANPA